MRGLAVGILSSALLVLGRQASAGQALEPPASGDTATPVAEPVSSPVRSAAGWSVQVGAAYERVSNGLAPWRSANVSLEATGRNRTSFQAEVRETLRFSQRDHDVGVGIRRPVARRFIVSAGVEASPTHHVLPAWAVLGTLEAAAGGGWGLGASLQHRQYAPEAVDLGSVTVERYLGSVRAAYTIYLARLHGGQTATSQRLHGYFSYGSLNSSVGVSVAAGEEIENVPVAGVLRTPVHAVAVVGRQWFSPAWFLTYDALAHEQGALYTRQRLSVGVGCRF